ncbi:MAG: DUF4340 domain-containing protein [Deltaproteobacteria bacterium]|nr:DUF4340 domain-containing protein [Deltaproteobacteria bacterium]
MSRSIKLLLLLLVLQTGLVAWINLPGDDPGASEADKPLLALDAEGMDAVTIEQQGEAPLRMERKEDRWVLPGSGDFPVSSAKFDQFTEKLLGARRSWPVGKTLVAARQFKVTPDQFERRVRLLQGTEVLGDVFLGSSPGFRKVHARLDGDPQTYAVDFNAFDAPVEADSWYDTEVLKTAAEEIARIDLGAYALTAGDGGFQVEGLRENEETDAEPVRELVERVMGTDFTGVLSEDGKALFEAGEPVVEYTIEMKKGSAIKHTVVSPEEGDHYILKSTAQPHYFEVDKDRFDKLRNTSRVQVVKGVVSG